MTNQTVQDPMMGSDVRVWALNPDTNEPTLIARYSSLTIKVNQKGTISFTLERGLLDKKIGDPNQYNGNLTITCSEDSRTKDIHKLNGCTIEDLPDLISASHPLEFISAAVSGVADGYSFESH